MTEWQTTRYRYTWIHISSSKHVTQIKQIILNILNTNQFNTLSSILSFFFYSLSFSFLLFLFTFIRKIENYFFSFFFISTFERSIDVCFHGYPVCRLWKSKDNHGSPPPYATETNLARYDSFSELIRREPWITRASESRYKCRIFLGSQCEF